MIKERFKKEKTTQRKNNSKKKRSKKSKKNERQKTLERKDGKIRSFLYSIGVGNSHFAEPSLVERASDSAKSTFLPCVKDLKT